MRRPATIFLLLAALLSACGLQEPSTSAFSTGSEGALAPLANGGIRYADGTTGDIYDIDSGGRRNPDIVAHVDIDPSASNAVTGLVVDATGRTFAAWTRPGPSITVGQVSPGATRVIWTEPITKTADTSGRLAITPGGRLLVALGADESTQYGGELITLSPDADATQRPNVISTNWNVPGGIAYSQGGSLWVAGGVTGRTPSVGRAGPDGFTGTANALPKGSMPKGLTAYGDRELVLCLADSGTLQRYLLTDAQAVPGRVVARDCIGGVVQLSDNRLVYIAKDGLKVTRL